MQFRCLSLEGRARQLIAFTSTDQLKSGEKLGLLLSVKANYGYSLLHRQIEKFYPFQAERDSNGRVVYEEQP
jgi:hypothetical protein